MTPVSLQHAGPWYRAAAAVNANPFHTPSPLAVNRFNDGGGQFALLYLAADAITALREARALYGPPAVAPVAASSPTHWIVFEYLLALPATARIVDFGDPSTRQMANTSVQTLTGDWESYSKHGPLPHAQPATTASGYAVPTQQLAKQVHRQAAPHLSGFLSPSAQNPPSTNLILFFGRLPQGALQFNNASSVAL